jgi:beta-glucosidase
MSKKLFFVALIFYVCISALLAKEKFWKWERYGIPPCALETCTPEMGGEKNDLWWITYIQKKHKQPHKDLLFIGDSITDHWSYPGYGKYQGGLTTWNKRYQGIATNFGVIGDNTQNVLWRLTEGKALEGYTPKHIILLIGVNNLLQKNTPKDTAAGIKAITGYLRKTLPDSKVLMLGIFPCSEFSTEPIREKIRAVNMMSKNLADNKNVYFADIGNVFLEKDGSISSAVMSDFLHPSPKGYEMWADAMEPYLKAFLNG